MEQSIPQKKIMLVITKSNFGGAQKYVYDIATTLPKDIFDVSVAVGGSGPLIAMLEKEEIRVMRLPSLTRDVRASSDTATFFELLSLFKKERPDIVHVNSAKAGGIGTLAARLAGVPTIIFTAHGWAFNESRPYPQRMLITFFSWITVLLAHQTIAVSDAVKNGTLSWPFVGKKIVVIKNEIKEPAFYPKEMSQEKLFSQLNKPLPSGAFIIGTIAELHKNKGLSYAIEAFSQLAPQNPSLYYLILGGGEERTSLEALVRFHNLEDRVFLLGFVDEAARFLPAFDLFLLPSLTEGLALVILEAGLARLPLIATNVGGIPEVIENNVTGLLVPSCDPHALAESLQKLQQDPSLAQQMGERIKQRVEKEFSFKKMFDATVLLYEKSSHVTPPKTHS